MARIDIDIEDYIDEIDDDCLIAECCSRIANSKYFKEKFDKKIILEELTTSEIIESLIEELRLSLVDAENLKDYILNLKK